MSYSSLALTGPWAVKQNKSIHSSARNYFSFFNCHVHADALSDTCGSAKSNSACSERKEYWEKSVLPSRPGHHLLTRPVLLTPHRAARGTLGSSQLDRPLRTSRCQNRSSWPADTNCLLNSKSQWRAELKQERSSEVPARDQQRISNCAEILSGWSSATTSSQQLQLTMTSLYVPFYHDCGHGWKWG